MKTTAFVIEENGVELQVDLEKKVVFSGNFCEYEIVKSIEFDDFYKIIDKVENRDGVTLVNLSLNELIFADRVVSFEEILKNLDRISNCDFINLNFGLEIEQNEILTDSILVKINGFDEAKDSFKFDFATSLNKINYKYSISENQFFADMKFDFPILADKFIKTFSFSTLSLDNRDVQVFVYIGTNEVYKKILRGDI